VHIKADGLGRPLAFVLTEGQRHDNQVFEELMECGKVKRSSSGRPRIRPRCIVADRSYSNERIRTWLKRRKVRAIIPRTSRERKQRGRRPLDGALYKERNRVERLVARLKQFRRIATRYEKTAESYLTMLTLAAILVWL
jgi:transposase